MAAGAVVGKVVQPGAESRGEDPGGVHPTGADLLPGGLGALDGDGAEDAFIAEQMLHRGAGHRVRRLLQNYGDGDGAAVLPGEKGDGGGEERDQQQHGQVGRALDEALGQQPVPQEKPAYRRHIRPSLHERFLRRRTKSERSRNSRK